MIQYIIAAGIGAFLGSRSKKSKKSYAHGGEVNGYINTEYDDEDKTERVVLYDDKGNPKGSFATEKQAMTYAKKIGLNPDVYAEGGSVKDHLDKSDMHLREAGTILWENKNIREKAFRKEKEKFDDSIDDLLTRRYLDELDYEKGGSTYAEGGSVDKELIFYKDADSRYKFQGHSGYLVVRAESEYGDGNKSKGYFFLDESTGYTETFDTEAEAKRGLKKYMNEMGVKVVTKKQFYEMVGWNIDDDYAKGGKTRKNRKN